MNIFSFTGDLLHLASILLLLLKIYTTKNVRGLSMQTQLLYLIVFVCRYTDLFWNFFSLYNEVMKLIFIVTSAVTLHFFFVKPYKATYNIRDEPPMQLSFLLGPCAMLALLFTEKYTIYEILWTFSIFLEAVAIVPQLLIVHRHAKANNGFVENLTSHYVFTLGGYRAMYIINWIYRYFTESHFHTWLPVVCGLIQTGIYCDFFYYYLTANLKGEKMSLPI